MSSEVFGQKFGRGLSSMLLVLLMIPYQDLCICGQSVYSVLLWVL